MRKLAHMSMTINHTRAVIPEFHVGDRLGKARETAGLTQTEFGLEIGASRATVSRWESGKGIKKSTILLYSMRTQVPVEWLETGMCTPPDLNREPTGYGSLRRVAALAA